MHLQFFTENISGGFKTINVISTDDFSRKMNSGQATALDWLNFKDRHVHLTLEKHLESGFYF